MRTLKFRAWDKAEKKMLFDADPFVIDVWGSNEPLLADPHKRENCIFEQYIGLKDKNDKEIYEGDILRWANSTGREITAPVVWNTRAWCWTAGDYMLGGLLEFDLEVVGNIHEDLKLLEAK